MGLNIDDLVVESTLSASTLTATTLYIGTNNIGGSSSSFNSLSATTLSAGTLYSGSTNLYSIFLTTADGNDITRVQPGSNITTGGTGNNPTVSVVASPSFNALTLSGLTSSSAGATFANLSGTNIFSGSVNVQTYFNLINAQLLTKANDSGDTFTGQVNASSLSATTLSGGTILSGSTNLYQIFAQTGSTLIHKSGTISGSTFSGNPKKATVTFGTEFANTNYAITISGSISRAWSWESKTTSGFTINANANGAFATNNVDWTATQYGEK
jgi:hypothetical protein